MLLAESSCSSNRQLTTRCRSIEKQKCIELQYSSNEDNAHDKSAALLIVVASATSNLVNVIKFFPESVIRSQHDQRYEQ
jgi:hypothetical protein